jgi:hypothetical protein
MRSSRLESDRGATLEGHLFTVRITSPLDNVFRIRVSHHRGRTLPPGAGELIHGLGERFQALHAKAKASSAER